MEQVRLLKNGRELNITTDDEPYRLISPEPKDDLDVTDIIYVESNPVNQWILFAIIGVQMIPDIIQTIISFIQTYSDNDDFRLMNKFQAWANLFVLIIVFILFALKFIYQCCCSRLNYDPSIHINSKNEFEIRRKNKYCCYFRPKCCDRFENLFDEEV